MNRSMRHTEMEAQLSKSRGTQIKDAIAQWEQREGKKVDEVEEVKMYAMFIEKMDSSISSLCHCTKLSLSTNCIEKIANLNGFKNLRILSLGRNNIKNFIGLEVVADTLEQLWISYNKIERLTGIRYMKVLKVLYISNNNIADWDELRKLCELQNLEDIVFTNNPVEERYSGEGIWREKVANLLPKLKKLDGVPVIRLDDERFGLEPLNLGDTKSPTPTRPGTKTRPTTQMTKTPEPKSAKGQRRESVMSVEPTDDEDCEDEADEADDAAAETARSKAPEKATAAAGKKKPETTGAQKGGGGGGAAGGNAKTLKPAATKGAKGSPAKKPAK